MTGLVPRTWSWATEQSPGGAAATLVVGSSGLYTLSLLMREDGVQVDRLLLTTDTNYIPTGFGPEETARLTGTITLSTTLDRVIEYDYDKLYRLTEASYSTGELYEYAYDPVGNRLKQVIDGNTTAYLYDAANRLEKLNGQPVYTFDANGNLLNSDILTNTFDAANRLIQTQREGTTLQPIYNGVGDRVGQTVGVTTTYFALDIAGGLPEVIYTSEGNAYLHLPGVIVAESSTGETRYLLSDGLGSIRQAVDEDGAVVAYNEFDPWGNPVQSGSEPYGFTGEWWEDEVGLLHLRARWYLAETGTFLSKDPVESEPPYLYVRGNPINLIDPLGTDPPTPQGTPEPITPNNPPPRPAPRPIMPQPESTPCPGPEKPWRSCDVEVYSTEVGDTFGYGRHLFIVAKNILAVNKLEGIPVDDWPEDDLVKQFIIHSVFPFHGSPPQKSEFGRLFVTEIDGGLDMEKILPTDPSLAGPVVVGSDETCEMTYVCLRNIAQIINAHNFSYWPLTQNSNSAAYTMLKHCGLSLQYPVAPGHPYGFGNDLLLLEQRWPRSDPFLE